MEKSLTFFRRKASSDFDKARNKAFFNELISKIFNKQAGLLQFDEVKYLLSPQGMVYRGIKAIPIERIIGSEGRYRDFDKKFMPLKTHTRSRWENIDVMKQQERALSPISVYKLGDYYFVRDGNHRVSVAKEMEQDFIDAEIVELFTKVKPEKFNQKGLLLADSHRYFLEKSKFDEIFPGTVIRLTSAWGYYRLLEHIQNYKYFLGEKEKKETQWNDAVKKWYANLYMPVIRLIRKRKVMRKFPKREPGDLYIWIMDHWHFLKERYGNVPIEQAIESYLKKFGKVPFYDLVTRVRKLFTREKKPTGAKK
jgi:hypothetical protein